MESAADPGSVEFHPLVVRLINGSLLLMVAGGLALLALLAAGLADPPRVGNRSLIISPVTLTLAPHQHPETDAQRLPASAGWTLMLSGHCAADTVPVAGWGFELSAGGDTVISLVVYGDGYYRLPPFVPDTTHFIHIRPQSNELMLLAESDGTLTLRINREIAWRGPLTAASEPLRLHLLAHGSPTGRSECHLDGGAYWFD
jgi:hypothetical protein